MKSQITIKKIQELLIQGVQTIYVDDDTSRRMWWASLEVIQKDFLSQNYKKGGMWVASPLPAFNDTATTEIYTDHVVGSVRCV